MPTPPADESVEGGERAAARQQGVASPVLPRQGVRSLSPRPGEADASSASAPKKFVDYRMESAPSWDGEMPETKYREYSRNLRLWLVEAIERLPGSLIGKRIIDGIPFGSRLAALLAHLSVEDITAEMGYEKIVAIIEEAHDYLRDAKLEQAFDQAIFKGRRRADQSLSGFVATKKAAFGELKRQGLDLLGSSAGSHLLGHLLLRQGNFSEDQRQRIKVLTDGSIDFPKVEKAIRKLFGETVDEVSAAGPRGRTFWQEEDDAMADDSEPSGYFGDEIYYYDEPDAFEDLLEIDEGNGEVFLCLDEPLPAVLEEDEAVSYAGELLSFVYGTVTERWSKGKSKGKGKFKGKGKSFGKDRPASGKGFGIYGTYADHRKALQDARTSRGFGGGKGSGAGQSRPRTSIQELQNRSRCHNCRQMGHWSKDCPQKRRMPSPQNPRPAGGPAANSSRPGGPSTNLFFTGTPSHQLDDAGQEFLSASCNATTGAFTGFSIDQVVTPDAVSASRDDVILSKELSMASAIEREPLSPAEEYMVSFLSYTYASCDSENLGTALVDTAAQHGLIGRETLARHDQYLQQHFQLRVQYSDEQGGTVRGVCGSEEITQVAYIPIGIGGRGGILRVQVVPGGVPCLIPAYFLHVLGAVIDMSSLLIAYTQLSVVQSMSRRQSGHVAVNLCEFGQGWYVPASYDFLKSEIWKVKGPFLKPSPELFVSLVDGTWQTFEMPPSVATAIMVQPQLRRVRRLAQQREALQRKALALQQREQALLAEAGDQEQVPESGVACEPYVLASGNKAWLQQRMGAVEQVPKMDIGKLNEWNTIMAFQPPSYKTPTEKAQEKSAAKEAKRTGVPMTPVPSTATSSAMPHVQLERLPGHPPRQASPSIEEMEVELDVPYHTLRREIGTPDSNELEASDREKDEMNLWLREGVEMEMPGPCQMCTLCHGMVHLMRVKPNKFVWGCLGGDPKCFYRWQDSNNMPFATNVKLCMACQKTALVEDMHQGRRAYRCPTCNDLTLHVEWTQVMTEFKQRGGYNVNFANEEFQTSGPMGASPELLNMVDDKRSVVHCFTGQFVKGVAPVRSRPCMGKRVIVTKPSPGLCHVVDIDHGGLYDYDLGLCVNAFVIQEFTDDFVNYLTDTTTETVEVTLDKAMKKQLLDGIERVIPDQGYFDLWEGGLDESSDEDVRPTEVFGARSRKGEHPGQPVGAWLRRPVLPPRPTELGLGKTKMALEWSQRRFLPVDVECDIVVQTMRRFRSDVVHMWRDYYGQAMYISLKPAAAFLPQTGPGHRCVRWTVVEVADRQWRWIEEGAVGKWHPEARKHRTVIVLYYWPEPAESQVLASSYDLTDREKSEVLRCHVNLGHPNKREFARLLKAAGSRHDVVQYVLREFECPGCVVEKRPPTRLPAATPRCFDFNVVIGVDILFVHGASDRAEHPVLNVTCVGTLYSVFGVIDPRRRSAELTWKAFMTLWLRVFGAPTCILYDEGNEFVGRAFQEGLEQHGIRPIEINRQAPFELGTVERRGAMFKEAYYRSRELRQPSDFAETEMLIYEVSWAIQTLTNRSGYSPAQRVFGRQPQVALDTLADGGEFNLSPTADSAWQRAHELRTAARKALIEIDAKSRVARAKLARPRQEINRLKFEEGEPVLIWKLGRRGSTAKVGPCWVVLQNGHTVWVTRRGELWKCNVAQVFKMGNADRAGLEAIPSELLQAKARLKYDSEKLMYKGVSSELDLLDEVKSEPESVHADDGPGTTTEIPVSDPLVPPDGGCQDDAVRADHGPGTTAEIPVSDPVITIDSSSSSSSGGSKSSSSSSGGSQGQMDESPTSSTSSSSSSTSTTPRAPSGQAEWPPAGSGTQLRKWVRYDHNPNRYRTSNSQGPMWSDVVQRITVDNVSGRVIRREDIKGDERSRDLHKPLPRRLTSLKTVLVYKRVAGHPDPGVPLTDPDRPELDNEPGNEDERLIDKRIKRGLDDPDGEGGSAPQRSKVFGAWTADMVTEHGDRSKFPPIANHRDVKLFTRVSEMDMVYDHSQIYGSHVFLTKKSGKELNEKHFNELERRMFDEAKVKEITVLENGSSIRFIKDPAEVKRIRKELGHRIMPSRFVLTKKAQELGEDWKAKARWILLGHRDPDALEMERFSPTPSGPTVHLAFQLISSLGFKLVIMDVTSAFGQSDAEVRRQGPLYASMPPTGIPGKEQWMLVEILTAIYGLVNAPACWRRTVRKVLLSLGYKESIYDPCLFILHYNAEERSAGAKVGCAGLVLLDVDDFAQGGGPRHESLMLQLKERFRFGKWRIVFKGFAEYLGRTVRQLEDGEIRIDMKRYIEEKLHPVRLPRERVRLGDDAELTEQETTMLRGAGGSLLWIGKEARPDVAGACSMAMSWGSGPPKISHVKQVNKTIAELKRTSDCYIRILPIPLESGMWAAVSDASVANDSEKSQGGFVITFVEKTIRDGILARFSINSWKSHRLRRVVKASLGSEALAMDDSLGELEWLRAMYAESCVPDSTVCDGSRFGPDLDSVVIARQRDEEESIMITDARALYDLFHRRSGAAGLCRRAQIDVSVMAASAELLRASVYWVPGIYMLADCLTKRVGNSTLMRKVMLSGTFALQPGPLQELINTASDAPPDGCDTNDNQPESV
ncbi:RE1 [Symbiodinium sp. CCMP2592]|nr:RE1 [Symbiodinium sp. CCMP2592]